MKEQELFLKTQFEGKHHQIFIDWLNDLNDTGWFVIKVEALSDDMKPEIIIHYDIPNENCIICEIDDLFKVSNFKIKHLIDDENTELKTWLNKVVETTKKISNDKF
jgi:hypothetical protein